ncbi:MAG TPA: DUF1289 domain-containing protein [Burkholderiaceae bacterium]|nr:DUF1289 domain-containing protein [Burkholderiaceae bacterium]
MSDSSAPLVPPCAFAAPVPSPCRSVCRMNPASGLCEGCWRTIDEIVQWAQLDDAARRAVWSEIGRRRAKP